jgi:hypothetical protein
MATESYEESLPMEGVPDRNAAQAFTSRRRRRSWRSSVSPNSLVKTRCTAGITEVATGMSEARSQQHRGKKTPTFVLQAVRQSSSKFVFAVRSAEAVVGRRETSGPPVVVAWSLSLRGTSPPRKWRERTGNTRGAGARSSIGWQTSVGRIARLLHREVARPVGDERALAGEKSVAPPDAGRGWAEGETMRVPWSKRTVFSTGRAAGVTACRFSIRRKAFSGFCPSCPYR